ncbi:MAG TPA: hypothetical protein VMA74_20785 [Dyella sp.]|uniref:hypothetical protein n=1 Tax=Dyella sp. TaxID=1869338 RepID=UPI002BEA7E7E|nr:hypothetical protein [Dyella sp.]HUB92173.1 hypothetical protein [Dyella sp.]
MKICSKIPAHKGNAREVDIHGTRYAFKHTLDNQDRVLYVAEVKNPKHQEVLLNSGDFYPFDPNDERQAVLRREEKPKEETSPATDLGFDQATLDEANKLLLGNVQAVCTGVSKVSSGKVVLAAIALEQKGTNRKGVLQVLNTTVEGLKAAGKLT